MRSCILLGGIAAAALLLAVAPARADVLTVFNASGSFADGSILSGTLTIDQTTGRISASNLITTGPSNFTFINIVNQSNTQVPGDYNVGDRNPASTEDFNFDLLDSSQMPLYGYAGGAICSNTAPCVNGREANFYNLITNTGGPGLLSGSLTPVPEPLSLAVVGSGLLGLAAVRRRKTTQA